MVVSFSPCRLAMPTIIDDLPNEVLTLIFSEIGPQTRQQTSPSLACRRWRPLAQEALFRDVHLRPAYGSESSWIASPATTLKLTTRS